jgi:hypothetical protein
MFFFIGRLKKFQRYVWKPFQQCIRDCGFPFTDGEIEGAAAFMGRCLRLDSKDRPTARDHLEDQFRCEALTGQLAESAGHKLKEGMRCG